jgi:cytochrome c
MGTLYIVEREGRILRVRPSTGGVFVMAQLKVSALRESASKSEDALHGITLDPAFEKNHRTYLFYAALDQKVDRLSRFVIKDGLLDHSSEKIIWNIPVDRGHGVCHHSGTIRFGPDGLLYLSVGDNTNPFESGSFAPLDYRPDRQYWDSARSAGNANDLRGKILRIRLTEKGYEIPPRNLFPKGPPKTRPEIYIMGCRNPFRMSIDSKNSHIYWGEVGSDARETNKWGVIGYDEFNVAKASGNFDWPFVIANNQPYPVKDFSTNKPGPYIDPAAPRNDSPRNTGLKTLPPAQPALIWDPCTQHRVRSSRQRLSLCDGWPAFLLRRYP